ncbi:MAG: hypothetical protein ACRCST_13275 [Turicibacter sp.]
MSKNYIKNAYWQRENGSMPLYFSSLGKMHYDRREIDGARVCSLSLTKPTFEKLTYEPNVTVYRYSTLKMGLVMRGNDVQSVKYVVHFYSDDEALLISYSEDIASEVTPNFKNICVTYKIPQEARTARIEYHLNGITTGMTLFKPSIVLD